MLSLSNAKYTNSGVLIIKDIDLEAFAYAQLKDYDKDYFKQPHPLDVDDFVEFYLQRNILYYNLSFEKECLGLTAISDGKIPIINSKKKVELKWLPKGTICIDLEACKNEARTNFTIIHEAAHSQFDTKVNPEILNSTFAIKDDCFAISEATKKRKSPKDWIEHHADKYATYILMPKKFVKILFNEQHKLLFKGKTRLSKNNSRKTWLLITHIAKFLHVSNEAVAYRIRDLNLISESIFLSLNIQKRKEVLQT